MKKRTFTSVAFEGDRTFTPFISAVCPFCQGTFTAGEFDDAGDGRPTPAVIHTVPHCSRFETLDVIEFMREARMAGARVLS